MKSSEEPIDEGGKTTRKLASVQIISEKFPHPSPINNETFEIVKVMGWQVVVKKNRFDLNEKIIYFEIDSQLPNTEIWAQELKNNRYKVKSFKIQGILTQGFIAKLDILKCYDKEYDENKYEIGTDLTDLLGIIKYENVKSKKQPQKVEKTEHFPDNLIQKSDEPRIQSHQQYLELFKGKPYYITLKYDGTSGTYLFVDDEFYICSRNNRVFSGPYVTVAQKYNIEEKLRNAGKKYAIQGEVYGLNIQKNHLNVDSVCFTVFTIKDLEEKKYLDMEELIKVCEQLDLPMVKILEKGDSFNYSQDQLKEMAKGNYEGTEHPREGIVIRLQKNWYIDKFNRFSFKYVNDDFLTHKK